MYELYFNDVLMGSYDFPETEESTFWHLAGRAIFLHDLPDGADIRLVSDNESEKSVHLIFSNGAFKVGMNNLHLKKSRYEKKMLRKVEAKTNTHLFYDIVPNNMGPITIDVGGHFGKIGEKGLRYIEEGNVIRSPYPSALYWVKYWQKITEGYDDLTDLLLDEDDLVENMFTMPDTLKVDGTEMEPDVELYEKLSELAKDALSDFNIDFLSNRSPFNARQIKSSWELYDQLASAETAEEANMVITKMIAVLNPSFAKKNGKRVTVNDFMVKPSTDPEKEKEAIEAAVLDAEVRIHAMEAVSQAVVKKKTKVVSPFGDVEVRRATEEEKRHVIQDLITTDENRKLVKEIYACHAAGQSEMFEKYCEARNIKEIQELFHGSRSENFISIITTSLTTRIKAANGRMFGNGIYFANNFEKSKGYTSYRGSRWANGSLCSGFIAVFEVAYGNAVNPDSSNITYNEYNASWMDAHGYDSLHARRGAGTGLRMDEIITYHDESCRIKYLIEFGDKEETNE